MIGFYGFLDLPSDLGRHVLCRPIAGQTSQDKVTRCNKVQLTRGGSPGDWLSYVEFGAKSSVSIAWHENLIQKDAKAMAKHL